MNKKQAIHACGTSTPRQNIPEHILRHNFNIDEQINTFLAMEKCGMITRERMLERIQEMEDERKDLIRTIHSHSIRPVTSKEGNGKKPRTRWTTRIEDPEHPGRYKWIRAANEDVFFKKLGTYYGLVDYYDEKHPHPQSLAGLYNGWLHYRLAKVRPGTVKKDQATWNRYYAGEEITWRPLAEIKVSEAFLWLSNKVTSLGLTKRQYNEMRGLWNRIEGYAYNDDLITRRLMRDVESPARNLFADSAPRYSENATFTRDELQSLYDMAMLLYPESHFNTAYLGLILNIFLGFRASELSCLRWDCINETEKTVTIRQSESPKHEMVDGKLVCRGYEVIDHLKCGHLERTVPLPAEAQRILAVIRKENLKHGVLSEYVFVQRDGERVHTRAFQKAIKKIYGRLGWTDKIGGVHEFRRTYATSLMNSNIDDKKIQMWMGHKDWSTTKRYYQYAEKTPDPEAADLVSKAVWG